MRHLSLDQAHSELQLKTKKTTIRVFPRYLSKIRRGDARVFPRRQIRRKTTTSTRLAQFPPCWEKKLLKIYSEKKKGRKAGKLPAKYWRKKLTKKTNEKKNSKPKEKKRYRAPAPAPARLLGGEILLEIITHIKHTQEWQDALPVPVDLSLPHNNHGIIKDDAEEFWSGLSNYRPSSRHRFCSLAGNKISQFLLLLSFLIDWLIRWLDKRSQS